MIKDNQKILNRIHILLDALLIILSYAFAYYLRFKSPLVKFQWFALGNAGYYEFDKYAQILLPLLPGYIIIYFLCGLYSPKRNRSTKLQFWDVFKANTLGIAYFASLLFILKEVNFGRKFTGLFFLTTILLESTLRFIIVCVLKFYRAKGYNLKHVLIVGYSYTAESYIDRIIANPEWGYCIHGVLDDKMERGTAYKKIKVIGSIDNLDLILPQNKLDEIIITLNINEYEKLEHIVTMCEKSGVHTKFIPDYHNIIPTKPYTEDMNGLPVIHIRHVPLNDGINRFIKRVVDIVGATVALTLFSIPMAIVALIIKITSPGPILFSQVRIGLHNREFKMYKFRSMEIQSESKEKSAWTVVNDPRVTGIGKFIRKTSVDELPQLFNVLKGEMSLVGPRPERPFFVEKFKEEIPRYMIKHQVRPGMTGWAQINGYRGDTSIRKRIDHDLHYIENWTFGLDIKILFLTVFKGFINRNAY